MTSTFEARIAETRARMAHVSNLVDVLDRTYKRNSDGEFSSSGGSDNDDFDEDPNVGSGVEAGDLGGEYGFGVDPKGVSYTELDVDDETGTPRFSAEYREKYGPVTSSSTHDTVEGGRISVVETEKGPFLHVADDSGGTTQRDVIQEFTKKEAGDVSTAVFEVYNGDKPTASAAKVGVRPAGSNPTRDGVVVRWQDGRESTFSGESGTDEAFMLQESLAMSADLL